MFWIVDSIIKSKTDLIHYKKKESPPRRKNKHNRVYLPLADLEQTAEGFVGGAPEDEGNIEEHSLMCYSDNDEIILHNRTI